MHAGYSKLHASSSAWVLSLRAASHTPGNIHSPEPGEAFQNTILQSDLIVGSLTSSDYPVFATTDTSIKSPVVPDSEPRQGCLHVKSFHWPAEFSALLPLGDLSLADARTTMPLVSRQCCPSKDHWRDE
jgi:hypothetical protein